MGRLHAWILRLVHVVIAFARSVCRLWSRLAGDALASWAKVPLREWQPPTQRLDVQWKRPSHLAVIILEEQLSYSDLANIVVWSRQYGVACVTLYNPTGATELDVCQLFAAITRSEADSDLGNKYSVQSVDYCSEKCSVASQDQLHHNGNSHRGDCACVKSALSSSCHTTSDGARGDRAAACRVLLLPRLDGGHGLIVAAARCRSRAMAVARRRRSEAAAGGFGDGAGDVSTPESLLHEDLGDRLPIASPEAAVLFGGVTNLCGYLPWHVRLTEIFTVPSHIGLKKHQFLGIMQRYGSTEQRLGT